MEGLQAAMAEGGPNVILALVALVGVALAAIFAGIAAFRVRVPPAAWFLAPVALVATATALAFFDLEAAARAIGAGDAQRCLETASVSAGKAISTLGLAVGLAQVLLTHQTLTVAVGLSLARGDGQRRVTAALAIAAVGVVFGGGAAAAGAALDARGALASGLGLLAGALALALSGAALPRPGDAAGWRLESELRATAAASLVGATLLGVLRLRAQVDITIFQNMADPTVAVFAPQGGWTPEVLPLAGAAIVGPLATAPVLRGKGPTRVGATVALLFALGAAAFTLVGVPLLWANASVDRCLAP